MVSVSGGMRWSGSERAWCGLFTALPSGRFICRHELTWYGKTPEFAAEQLVTFCVEREYSLDYVVAQPEIFPKADELGETVSETFRNGGVPMLKGSNDREACWSRLRSWLAVRTWDDGLFPSLLIHPDCKRLIKTLPSLVKSETRPDDVDATPDEYAAMGTALFAMTRPSPWQKVVEEKPVDPLSGAYLWRELRDGPERNRYLGWNRHRP